MLEIIKSTGSRVMVTSSQKYSFQRGQETDFKSTSFFKNIKILKEHVVPSIKILNGNLGFYPPNFDFKETLSERNVRINQYHSRKR